MARAFATPLGKIVGKTEGVKFSAEPVRIEVVAPNTPAARQVLRTYVDDIASSYYGRPATDEEIDAALHEDPSFDLEPPYGVFLVARQRDVVLGCAGLRWLPESVGEVKRVFVAPAARGRGLGARLMGELEHLAREHGLSALRLDTRHDLVEARRLYAASATRRCPLSTMAATQSTGSQSRWASARRRRGNVPLTVDPQLRLKRALSAAVEDGPLEQEDGLQTPRGQDPLSSSAGWPCRCSL